MMKKIFVLFFFICIALLLTGQEQFEQFFENKTLRIDYTLEGNSNDTKLYLHKLIQEPFWGGPHANLIDPFNYGAYKLQVFDPETKKLIYSIGFCSLFREWQTTSEAKNKSRAFYNTSVIPFPKKPVIIKIDCRNFNGQFKNLFEQTIDPKNIFIKKEMPFPYKTTKIIDSGDPSTCVDIVFIAESYTKDEMQKFISDAHRFSGYILNSAPFDKYKSRFNVWAIESISEDSGPDVPHLNKYSNTVTNFSFSIFGTERYLASFDTKAIRDIASNAPYDQIYVLINSGDYGGGGIFNHYTACTSYNNFSDIVAVHEFGHGFAGLADEYYSANVPYINLYNLSIEPWEPNITTLFDFDEKWKSMVSKKTPVPTPRDEEYNNTVGVFEGGGYCTEGVYSPFMDCKMKSLKSNRFCPVCEKAIQDMIKFYINPD